jgi:hypothetical protein
VLFEVVSLVGEYHPFWRNIFMTQSHCDPEDRGRIFERYNYTVTQIKRAFSSQITLDHPLAVLFNYYYTYLRSLAKRNSGAGADV